MDYTQTIEELEREKEALEERIEKIDEAIENLNDLADTEPRKAKPKKKLRAKKAIKKSPKPSKEENPRKKYTDEFFDYMKKHASEHTLPELKEMAEKKFGLTFKSDQSLYAALYMKEIKPKKRPSGFRQRADKINAEKGPSKPPINWQNDVDVKKFIKENRGMGDRQLLKVIGEKFGVDIGLKEIRTKRAQFNARYKYDPDLEDEYLKGKDNSDPDWDDVEDMLED